MHILPAPSEPLLSGLLRKRRYHLALRKGTGFCSSNPVDHALGRDYERRLYDTLLTITSWEAR